MFYMGMFSLCRDVYVMTSYACFLVNILHFPKEKVTNTLPEDTTEILRIMISFPRLLLFTWKLRCTSWAIIRATEYIDIHAESTVTLEDPFCRIAKSLNNALFLPGDLRLVLKEMTKSL